MPAAARALDKVINPGSVDVGRATLAPIYCRIQWDGTRLSIHGVEGPRRNGDCWGSAGQICMGYAHRDPAMNDPRYSSPTVIGKYADGWNEDLWFDFLEAWKLYHLNDMQSACEHQRALGWTYDTHRGQDCPTCGYRIGSAWLTMEVPPDTIEFLESLPDATTTPAWV